MRYLKSWNTLRALTNGGCQESTLTGLFQDFSMYGIIQILC